MHMDVFLTLCASSKSCSRPAGSQAALAAVQAASPGAGIIALLRCLHHLQMLGPVLTRSIADTHGPAGAGSAETIELDGAGSSRGAWCEDKGCQQAHRGPGWGREEGAASPCRGRCRC